MARPQLQEEVKRSQLPRAGLCLHQAALCQQQVYAQQALCPRHVPGPQAAGETKLQQDQA